MRKLTNLIMVIILLIAASQLAVAQQRGRGANGGINGNYSRDTDNDLKEFQKVVALQATRQQTALFLSWMKNTTDIKRRLHEVRSAAESKEAADQQGALKAAIEKNKALSHEFLGGFTEAQRTGLKKLVRKLSKANEELTKAVEIAIQEVAQAGDGTKRTAKLEKAEEASQNLLNEQKQLAAEMGINLQ